MEQQKNKNLEEKCVKLFHIENMLRNKYGLKPELSKILSKFIIDFSENLYESYDYEKVRRIRSAQSNLGLVEAPIEFQTKIVFYIGLLDKDDFSYKFSKHDAIEKVVEVYKEYKRCLESIEDLKEMRKDPDPELAEMAEMELEETKNRVV